MATQSTSQQTNRLINETSPYLLQHAHNPVDWWPWCEDAFEAARQADKPIFLSVGYSTCYWCHVMERESFEDEQTADVLNAHFIPIKVDREERPDVDEIYMAAVQALNQGQGGWPMSVFLEPRHLKPFLAGTYFPPQDMHGRPSFRTVLEQIAGFWRDRRNDVEQQAEQIASHISGRLAARTVPVAVGQAEVDNARSTLLELADAQHGGFGGPPKFPQPVFLDLLMETAWEDEYVRSVVTHTFDRMAMGGMYDQVGGGFHRYSVDAQWQVPHFEKMLYDNAQLLATAARLWHRTGDMYHERIAVGTASYIARRMQDEGGGLFSAEDAEVDTREGLTYLWSPQEVQEALEAAGRGDLVGLTRDVYGLDQGSNFRDPHHADASPANVLYLRDHPRRLAAEYSIESAELFARLDDANDILLAARDQRPQPATDDKVIAGWNGMMIHGLAEAGRLMDRREWIEMAARAASFVLDRMRDGTVLLRTFREDEARVPAFLEDYGFVIQGLLALHRADGQGRWLDEAITLARSAGEQFADEMHGGYYDTRADQSDLFVRSRSTFDGALPCGNSVMLGNLLDLHELTGDREWIERAAGTLASLSQAIHAAPAMTALAVRHLKRMLRDSPEAIPDAPAADEVAADQPQASVEVEPKYVELTDEPQAVHVRLTPPEGHFIHAHHPGGSDRTGLQVGVSHGGGVEMDANYPSGETLAEGIEVHRGPVTISVRIAAKRGPADLSPPQLVVRYQMCNDHACLAPITQTLPVELSHAGDRRS